MDRLDALLLATSDDSAESITLRGLTLHMLEGVAPRFYAERHLQPLHLETLERCRTVTYGFDDEHADPDRLQAGIDAWYLRHVRGLPHVPPGREQMAALVQALNDQGGSLYAWLLGELAARCGLDVRIPFGASDFKTTRLYEAYWLTHLVMLDSDYFTRPLSHAERDTWADAIAQLVPWLARKPNADLAGEVALCLQFLKRPEAIAARALIAEVPPGGDAHQQATVLLGLLAE